MLQWSGPIRSSFDAHFLAGRSIGGEPLDDCLSNHFGRLDALGLFARESERAHSSARRAGIDDVHLYPVGIFGLVRIGAQQGLERGLRRTVRTPERPRCAADG